MQVVASVAEPFLYTYIMFSNFEIKLYFWSFFFFFFFFFFRGKFCPLKKRCPGDRPSSEVLLLVNLFFFFFFFQSDMLPLFPSGKHVHNAVRHFSGYFRVIFFLANYF